LPTSIFTLADATKLLRKIPILKRCLLADYIESFQIDSTPLAHLKSFEKSEFFGHSVASAILKIDVYQFFKIINIRSIFFVFK
jgi:hypothetical protein